VGPDQLQRGISHRSLPIHVYGWLKATLFSAALKTLNRRSQLTGALALIAALTMCGVLTMGVAAAAYPPFDGSMSFPVIHGPEYPEEYSWEVSLGAEQELEAIDDQTARIKYADGTTAFVITAGQAHDADGSTVPTSLVAVTGGDVVTLLVHHRAGDPAAAGTPFAYPISPGSGWKGGFSTVIVQVPKDEQELREEREGCTVPRLKGKILREAKIRLRAAGCAIGSVMKRSGATAKSGKVIKQSPRPGQTRGPGAVVHVTLGKGAACDPVKGVMCALG